MQEAQIELLQRMPIFLSIPKNEFFFREHDQADSMFVLEAGTAVALKSWCGQDHLLRALKVGDCFGEMAVMDLSPRSASVRAVEDCTAIRISAANLYQMYARADGRSRPLGQH